MRKSDLSFCVLLVSLKLYFDTSVFVSLWKFEQHGPLGIPVSHYSEMLLEDVLSCRHSIATSSITLKEIQLKYDYLAENAVELFERLQNAGKLDLLPSLELEEEAERLNKTLGVGRKDCVHILASRNCDCLVSLDNGLIAASKGITNALKPQDLLF